MTERSMFWADGLGDGGPYTQDQLRLLYDALAGSEDVDRGVLVTQGNELAPSSTGNNNIRMATGRAVVDGTLYDNDAILDIVTVSPAALTGRRLVLQKVWATRTVRAVIISSADGVAAIPAMTKTDGTTWEIPICSFTISAAGVIAALTDQRQFCEGTSSRGITILDRDLTQVDVANTLVETSVYSHSIPANRLGADGGFLLILGGDMLVNAAGTLRINIEFGGAIVMSTSALDITDNADRYKWEMAILCMNSAVAAQKWLVRFQAVASAADWAWQVGGSTMVINGVGYASSAKDTASAQIVDVLPKWSAASANLSFRKEIAVLELLPAA